MVQAICAAVISMIALLSFDADASEHPWRAGGGAGIETLEGAQLAPALGLHAGYGLSDFFDLHLELLGAHHGGNDATDVGSASLGISYKIDVFQWIPYVGVYAGVYYYAGARGPNGENGIEPGASIGGGLDYLFSRSFAMGVGVRQHSSFREYFSFTSLSILLRAEHRWGF